jgi:hypothetical protein
MKRNPMPIVSSANAKKMLFAIFCCTLLMLFSASAWASVAAVVDPCSAPTIGTSALPVGSAIGCGVLITITGTSGNLVATVTGSGTANGNPYDGDEDQLVGIQNNSSVTIGAIRLSSPLVTESSPYPYTSNLFAFDGDGPCDYYYFSDDEEFPATNDCYNNGMFVGATQADPLDYEGPNNTFVGISPDYTTGTVRFVTPIPPGGSTWFGMENTPATVVSIGETQTLTTGVTNVFPFGPFTCTSDGCSPGSGVWTENHTTDDAQFTPVSQLTDVDQWTLLPIPVCAGPVGESPFGPFGSEFNSGDFGLGGTSECPSYGPPAFQTEFPVTYPNQTSLACVPYLDYSSSGSPMCVEFERDCIESGEANDCGTVQWTNQLDYDIDNLSLGNSYLIGGPAVLFAPGLPAPTTPTQSSEDPFNQVITDFSVNAITSYTGAATGGDPPPPKAGGKDGKSVFVSAFSPYQAEMNPIQPGVTVGFPGFEFPTSNTSSPSCAPEQAQYLLFPSGKQVTLKVPAVNCLLKVLGVRVPWLLLWDDTTTSGAAVPNLQLCKTLKADAGCLAALGKPVGNSGKWQVCHGAEPALGNLHQFGSATPEGFIATRTVQLPLESCEQPHGL